MWNKNMITDKKYIYYIGIDCGVNTGLGLWDRRNKKLCDVTCVSILAAIDEVKNIYINNPDELFVRVEDARLRKWIPQEKNEKAERGKREGAGSVKRDAGIWEEFLMAYKIPYEMVAPKDNKTKLSADYFKQLTGWQGSTNEHGRDAAMLVFGY